MIIAFSFNLPRTGGDKHQIVKDPLTVLLAFVAAISLQAQAKELLSNQSSNPSAAQFRNVRTVGDIVCGEINKPNSQGGYDGFVRFVFRSEGDWAVERGAYYRFAEGGKQMGTEFMFENASREEKWDITRATQLLEEANAATARIEKLFKSCG